MCGDFRATPGEHFFVGSVLDDEDMRHGEIDLVTLNTFSLLLIGFARSQLMILN